MTSKKVEKEELSSLLGRHGKFCIPSRFRFEPVADFLQKLAAFDERAKCRKRDFVAEHIFVIHRISFF